MTESVQQMILNAIPVIITAVAAGIVTVKQGNKASARTDEKVAAGVDAVANKVAENAAAVADKLADVHQTVNGNLSALQAKHDALAEENAALKEQLARAGKRSTDKRSPDRKPSKP